MKYIFLFLLTFIPAVIWGQEDYLLQINNQTFPVSLDSGYRIQVKGESLMVRLSQNDTLVFRHGLFSFNYLKDYKVSKLVIEEGIDQYMIMSADGSGIAIQVYSNLDPTMLNEMMLNEVTKESRNYGYELSREDYRRRLISGQTLDVTRGILTYKEDKSIYEIATFGYKDEGILIITIISNESMSEQGQDIIRLMWNSLSIEN